MKRTMLASTLVFSLALVLAAVPVNQAWGAACGPIDLDGSEWWPDSSMKTSVQTLGKVKLRGQMFFRFISQFTVIDPDGDSFYGTYQTDLKGKVQLTPNPGSLEDYIGAKILSVALATGHTVSGGNIQVAKVKALAKVKSVKTGITLSVSISIKATADISVDSQAVRKAKISISLKAKGTKEMSVASSRWWIETKYKAGVKGLGKGTDVGTLDVFLGPNIGKGVPVNEFLAIDDEYNEF
ncbi:hypothetical protein KA005_51305, partial [bacterium]|nr:hypothetical protein [bacterium]